MKIIVNLFTLLVVTYLTPAYTQEVFKGNLTNENGTPLENVLIQNLRNRAHAHSDKEGNFTLENTIVNDTLKITYPEYELLYHKVENNTPAIIILFCKTFKLEEVSISGGLKQLNTLSKIDLEIQPVSSSQELLRKVPGLFIGQHAGGGKAEQIFLRGFDIDHGTDINISVDGMPVNMVSHAHGQGYADLHFLIPETIEEIDFDKGPYFAEKGDLTTAGYVAFKTKDKLNNSFASAEMGQYNTFRVLSMFNLLNTKNQNAYFTGEYLMTDNYFDAPQNFSRINLFGKYSATLSTQDKISISASHFKSLWDASGQIPERAVNEGLISFYGAIDPTEGGNTSRSNFNVQHSNQTSENSYIKNSLYVSHYDFELFSNFTFFLEDPINGDQIRQKEKRLIYGIQSEYNENVSNSFSYKTGAGFRNDNTHGTELSHTVNRNTVLEHLSLGDITQNNLFAYTSADYKIDQLLINLGLRVDYFKFDYVDKLLPTYVNNTQSKGIVSPKVNFLYTVNHNLNLFLKMGKGFHSNDTRAVVAQQGKEILPAAYGTDLGMTWKPIARMFVNAALWYLYLEQEFVYVGDAAIVEPGGKTARKGIDIGARYQITDWLFFNTDATYTHARSIDEENGADYIPLAQVFTLTGGLSIKNLKGFSGSLRARHLGDRPANETNTVKATGYTVTDLSLSYQIKKCSLGVNIDNIFNVRWKETQFLTESRLANESAPVDEIHFTAGTPFNARFIFKYRF